MQQIDFEKYQKAVLVYLEMLLEKRGMQVLPGEIFADMILDLYLRFEQLLFLTILQEVDDEKFKQFESFMENDHSQEESLRFLTENVENLDEITGKAMREFESIYLSENTG